MRRRVAAAARERSQAFSVAGGRSDDRLKQRAIRTCADKRTTANLPQLCPPRYPRWRTRVAIISCGSGTDSRSRNRAWALPARCTFGVALSQSIARGRVYEDDEVTRKSRRKLSPVE